MRTIEAVVDGAAGTRSGITQRRVIKNNKFLGACLVVSGFMGLSRLPLCHKTHQIKKKVRALQMLKLKSAIIDPFA